MKNYRLSMMLILIVFVFLYMLGILGINEKTNFALTSSALILSVSAAIDTFSGDNKYEKVIRYILDTIAIGFAIIIPHVKNTDFIDSLMEAFDSNVLLLLALFFTMAGQWAVEIKIKDIKRGK